MPADERVRRSIPYLRRMRNTAMAWCLYRIFRDLYDFDEPHLTESNYRDLIDKVARTGQDPAWAPRILRDRCNIRTVVTSLGNRSADPAKNPDNVLFMLDAHYLFCPGVATDLTPFFAGRTTKAEYYEALCRAARRASRDHRATGAAPARLARPDGDRAGPVQQHVHSDRAAIPAARRVAGPARPGAGRRGRDLSDADIDALVRFVTWEVLAWHHENRKAFQIAVGAEYFICDGKSIPRFQETWTSEMARAFHHFGNARFDLMMASDVLTHEMAVLARQFPNVYVSGYWWHNFFPATIEKIIGLRFRWRR